MAVKRWAASESLENDHEREVYNGGLDNVSRIDLKEGQLQV
jgi:hypothetical protein